MIEKNPKNQGIAIYKDFRNEVQTRKILKILKQRKKTIFIPSLSLNRLTHLPLKKDIKKIDIMIIPGLAFDHRGYRLGYGRGYYDRVLTKAKKIKSIMTIGMAFEFQVIQKLPKDKWDEPVKLLITEKKTRIFR